MAVRIILALAIFAAPGAVASNGKNLKCAWAGEYECTTYDLLYSLDGVLVELNFPSEVPPRPAATFVLSDKNNEGVKFSSGLFEAIFPRDQGGPEPATCTTEPWDETLAMCTDSLDATVTKLKFRACGHVELIQYEPATASDFGMLPFAARATGCMLKK